MKGKQLIIVFLLVFVIFQTSFPSKPLANSSISPSIGELYDWVNDEKTGFLYIINEARELIFLNKTSMKIDSKLKFSTEVYDMVLHKDKLYVSTRVELYIINTTTKQIEKTIPLGGLYEMAVADNRLFYVTEYTYSPVYELDLTTGKAKKLSLKTETGSEIYYYNSSLAIDPTNDILFVSQGRTSGSEVFAVNLSTYTAKHHSTYDQDYGFPYPYSILHYDNGDIFYAGHKLDGENLAVIHGQYRNNQNGIILDVSKNFVVTQEGVFNRHTYEFVMDAPGGGIIMDDQDYAYIYLADNTLEKVSIWEYIDSSDTHYTSEDAVEFMYPITDFVVDHASGRIVAISEEGQRLYYIRMSDMRVEKEIMIGSRPVDVKVSDGKVFVALYGSTKIAVTSIPFDGKTNYLIVDTNPYQIEAFHQQVVYANDNQHVPLKSYDLQTNKITDITKAATNTSSNRIYSPDLLYHEKTNRLYVGETNLSGSDLFQVDATTLTFMQMANHDEGYGFPYPKHNKLFVSDDDVIFDKFFVDANDLSNEKGQIRFSSSSEELIGVTKDYVFSNSAIYERLSFDKVVDIPVNIALAKEVEATGEFYLYSDEIQALIKYSTVDEFLAELIFSNPEFYKDIPQELLSYEAKDIYGSFAYEQINDFMQADLVKGFVEKDGTVLAKPGKNITRAEFVAILVRSLGLTGTEGAKNFEDVKSSTWYYPYIQIATAHGIVDGVNSKQFAPTRNIRRDEIAKLIVRAFEKSIDFSGTPREFSDVSAKHWAKLYIDKASSVGIISGKATNTFAPQLNATRAEAIAMLARGYKQETSELPANQTLIDTVLHFENKMMDATNAGNFEELAKVISNYSTGFYKHFNLYNLDATKALVADGISLKHELTSTLSATVIQKANRFATIRLNGANYNVKYTKGTFSYTSEQNTSGILYLIKDSTGNWKIYSAELPYLFATSDNTLENSVKMSKIQDK